MEQRYIRGTTGCTAGNKWNWLLGECRCAVRTTKACFLKSKFFCPFFLFFDVWQYQKDNVTIGFGHVIVLWIFVHRGCFFGTYHPCVGVIKSLKMTSRKSNYLDLGDVLVLDYELDQEKTNSDLGILDTLIWSLWRRFWHMIWAKASRL